MKILLLLLCLPISAAAQIFKCSNNGNTVFSDSPCGKNAETIEVNAPRRNNMQLSNQISENLADQMHNSRRKRELKNSINRQRHRLKSLTSNYDSTREKLQEELSQVNASKQRYKQNSSKLQRNRLKEKAKDIRRKLVDAQRKYHSDKESAKSTLRESIRQQEQYE